MSVKREKCRIILIDGMCGAGKSTTAQKLSHQFAYHSMPFRWMHEEIDNHPIRNGEFEAGDLQTSEGMKENIDIMLKRWQALADMAEKFNGTYIIEGCFIHAIDRYFYKSVYNIEQTLDYFEKVSEILSKAGTLFVYLRSPNPKETLENVFPIRGQWWKDLILSPEEKFFNITEYKGEETVFEYWDLFHKISDDVFSRYKGEKLIIDAKNGSWADHPQKILDHLRLPYINVSTPEINNYEHFCGKYCVVGDEENVIEINYDNKNNVLYVKGFWPYMKLVPISLNSFELESFPITFTFLMSKTKKSVTVTGEYDWNIVGKTLIEIL